MSLNLNKVSGGGGTQAEALEAGAYPARLVSIIMEGKQPQRPFDGQTKAPTPMIRLTYELLDEFLKDAEGNEREDKPRWVSEDMPIRSLSSENAKLTKRYKALDPDEVHAGDLVNCLGAPVTVTLTVGNNGRNYVGNASPMRKREADKAPELVNPIRFFNIDDPDLELLASLPQWQQDRIKSNLDFEGSALQKALGGEPAPVVKTETAVETVKESIPVEDEMNDDDAPF